jgi:uncharacterized protein
MRELKNYKNKINSIVQFFYSIPEILTVYIFGSYGTEKQTKLSDIDFGILFTKKISMMYEMKIMAEISSILGMDKIDMVNLNSSPVYFQHRVISSGDIIYEKNRIKTQEFVENVLEIQHDYSIILRKYNIDLEEGLREELLNV